MHTVGIIIASDSSFEKTREDLSGPLIKELCTKANMEVKEITIVADDKDMIVTQLHQFVEKGYSLILTSGGTGLSPRDVTPEATKEVIEKEVLGISIAMIQNSLRYTPRAMLSRAVAGTCKQSLIINLPGSPKAVKENLDYLLPVLEHGLDVLEGDVTNCART